MSGSTASVQRVPLRASFDADHQPATTPRRRVLRWIATPERDTATTTLERRLWDTADQFRANSGLKAQEYSGPILGLIFLRFAEVRFAIQRSKLEGESASSRRGSRVDEPAVSISTQCPQIISFKSPLNITENVR